MPKQLSIYLDLCRFLAAAMVFVSHASGFTGGFLWQLNGLGHEAVVYFFVLSGFVIAYVTDGKESTWTEYGLNRAARIYSVALPALLLTIVCDLFGRNYNLAAYTQWGGEVRDPLFTVLNAVFFVNESWSKFPVFSNLPYWSLGYEVWYYVLFGVLLFSRGIKRWALASLCLLIMGLSVVLYLPIWMLGVACYRYSRSVCWSRLTALSVFALSAGLITVLCLPGVQHSINHSAYSVVGETFVALLFEPAEQFAADYFLGLAIALHLVAAAALAPHVNVFGAAITRGIRYLAAHTFSLYLYHMPLLFLVAALWPWQSHRIEAIGAAFLGVPAVIFLLARVTESKKQAFKSGMERALTALGGANTVAPPSRAAQPE